MFVFSLLCFLFFFNWMQTTKNTKEMLLCVLADQQQKGAKLSLARLSVCHPLQVLAKQAGCICHKLSASVSISPSLHVLFAIQLFALLSIRPTDRPTDRLADGHSLQCGLSHSWNNGDKATLERTLPPDVQEDAIHNKARTVKLRSAPGCERPCEFKKQGGVGQTRGWTNRNRGQVCDAKCYLCLRRAAGQEERGRAPRQTAVVAAAVCD